MDFQLEAPAFPYLDDAVPEILFIFPPNESLESNLGLTPTSNASESPEISSDSANESKPKKRVRQDVVSMACMSCRGSVRFKARATASLQFSGCFPRVPTCARSVL